MEEKFKGVKVISFISAFFGLLMYALYIGQDEIVNKKSALVAKLALRWTVYGIIAKIILTILLIILFIVVFVPHSVEISPPISPYY